MLVPAGAYEALPDDERLLPTEYLRHAGQCLIEWAVAEALQQAQLHVLRKPGPQHPSYWAPFLLTNNWL